MQEVKMEVSKKNAANGNKYEKLGDVSIFVPTLSEVFPDAKVQKDAEGKEVADENGLPVYEDEKHNYVQGALFAAVKAQARNKLVSGTVNLKPGASIAADWDALMAEGERVGNGAALVIVSEAKKDFAKYVTSLNKTAAAQQTLNLLFGNKQALALQTKENKAKMEAYVTGFAETLDEGKFAKYEKYITGVLAACASQEEEAINDF